MGGAAPLFSRRGEVTEWRSALMWSAVAFGAAGSTRIERRTDGGATKSRDQFIGDFGPNSARLRSGELAVSAGGGQALCENSGSMMIQANK